MRCGACTQQVHNIRICPKLRNIENGTQSADTQQPGGNASSTANANSTTPQETNVDHETYVGDETNVADGTNTADEPQLAETQ